MSYRLTSVFAAFAALLTASILPAAAQPKLVSATKNSVTIKVDYLITTIGDLDALGINFDLVPLVLPSAKASLTPQKPLFLEVATGDIARQLYRTLTRRRKNICSRISALAVSTPDSSPVTISVDEAIPGFIQPSFDNDAPTVLPQVKRMLQVQGSLTLTPRVNADHSITLGFGLPTTLLRTIASDDTMVISGIRSQPDGSFSRNGIPSIVSVGGHMLPGTGQALLIFITPTIVSSKP